MKNLLALSLLAGLALQPLAAEAPPTEVMFFDHARVAEDFVRGFPMLVNDRFKVQPGRRTGPGQVEIHDRDTDVFYVLEGGATFVTGGTPVDPKRIAPEETRAPRLEGGVPHHLAKGDVIVIPPGVPHCFTKIEGTFSYFVVKVTTA